MAQVSCPHFTSIYASWTNQVERWFGIMTQKVIRRVTFRNVGELTSKINAFVENYNAQARPFFWVATAESILAKIQRFFQNIFPGRYTRPHIWLEEEQPLGKHNTSHRRGFAAPPTQAEPTGKPLVSGQPLAIAPPPRSPGPPATGS